MFSWEELKTSLYLESLDQYLFRGASLDLGLIRVFGGQVLAQCLNAAYRSVDEEKVPHSLHGYFLRPGDFNKPIIYEVDPIRNGRSFSTRRVVARQNGEAIFNSSVSFHKIEEGPSHQFDLPEDVPPVEQVESDICQIQNMVQNLDEAWVKHIRRNYLVFPADIIELRSPFLGDVLNPGQYEPKHGFWFKVHPDVGSDPVMHMTLLAFISDKGLMSTGIRPHGEAFLKGRMMGASLDHSMWFHGQINVNEWSYYFLDSPRSGRARSFNRGSFYAQNGRLIASTAQEGLFRFIDKKSD